MPIVNDGECVRKINTVTEKIFIMPASSFCAGGEAGHDACQVTRGHGDTGAVGLTGTTLRSLQQNNIPSFSHNL